MPPCSLFPPFIHPSARKGGFSEVQEALRRTYCFQNAGDSRARVVKISSFLSSMQPVSTSRPKELTAYRLKVGNVLILSLSPLRDRCTSSVCSAR